MRYQKPFPLPGRAVERGYVTAEPGPYKKSQKAYRVIYLPEDTAIMKREIGSNLATEVELVDGQLGSNLATEVGQLGSKVFYEPEQYQRLPDDNTYCETVNTLRQTQKNAAEAGSPAGDKMLGNEESKKDRKKKSRRKRTYDTGPRLSDIIDPDAFDPDMWK